MHVLRRPAAAVIATLTLALGLSAWPSAAQAATATGWQRVYRSSSASSNQLQSVAAISATNAWAVGSTTTSGLVMHWNGAQWRSVTAPGMAGYYLTDVEASSASNVWIFGASNYGVQVGLILRWNGTGWLKVPLPAGVIPNGAVVSSPSSAWIIGTQLCGDSGNTLPCETTLYHWNGSAWTPYQVPTLVDTISGSGASDVWAAGEGGATLAAQSSYSLVAFRWNGSAWKAVPMPHPHSSGWAGITVASPGNVWLAAWLAGQAGQGFALHWNGTRWQQYTVPKSIASNNAPVADGGAGVWLGSWAHWTGSHWVNTVPGPAFCTDGCALAGLARVPGRTTVWGVGYTSRSASGTGWDSLIGVYGKIP
jgi:hypothetical protein